jgi:Anti-sigma-K factor rskA
VAGGHRRTARSGGLLAHGVPVRPGPGQRGRLGHDHRPPPRGRPQRAAVLTAARLPALTGGRVHQVWVIGPAGARSAGFLSGTALVLTGVRAGDRVGVTVEPPGGTSQPTPIVLVPVPA